MSSYHEAENLIWEIKKRNIIWDSTREEYKNKMLKHDAWIDVCTAVRQDYNDASDGLKQRILSELQSRWKSIRDANNRNQKKIKGKSGCGARGSKKYVFADLLTFLQKTSTNRETDDSLETYSQNKSLTQDTHGDEQKVEPISPSLTSNPGPATPTPGPASSTPGPASSNPGPASSTPGPASSTPGPASSTPGPVSSTPGPASSTPGPATSTPGQASSSMQQHNTRKRRRKTNIEERMIAFMDRCDDEDPDKDFFNCLLPSVRTLTEDQKLEFRSQVITLLQRIKFRGYVAPPNPLDQHHMVGPSMMHFNYPRMVIPDTSRASLGNHDQQSNNDYHVLSRPGSSTSSHGNDSFCGN